MDLFDRHVIWKEAAPASFPASSSRRREKHLWRGTWSSPPQVPLLVAEQRNTPSYADWAWAPSCTSSLATAASVSLRIQASHLAAHLPLTLPARSSVVWVKELVKASRTSSICLLQLRRAWHSPATLPQRDHWLRRGGIALINKNLINNDIPADVTRSESSFMCLDLSSAAKQVVSHGQLHALQMWRRGGWQANCTALGAQQGVIWLMARCVHTWARGQNRIDCGSKWDKIFKRFYFLLSKLQPFTSSGV